MDYTKASTFIKLVPIKNRPRLQDVTEVHTLELSINTWLINSNKFVLVPYNIDYLPD
jgi:hypothetical protein